jgi:hypothetical protein
VGRCGVRDMCRLAQGVSAIISIARLFDCAAAL